MSASNLFQTIRAHWALVLVLVGTTAGVLLLGGVGDGVPTGAGAAVTLAALGLFLPIGWSLPALLIAAHSVELLTEKSVGPLSPVDLMVLALLLRAVVTRLRPIVALLTTPPAIGALSFAVVGALATLHAPENAAITAFLRVTAYLGLGVALIAALSDEERRRGLAAIVGVATGDALGAIIGLTDRAHGTVIGGRYLGTLGDPAQFGIPVAVALLVIITTTWLIPQGSSRRHLQATGVIRIGWAGALAAALVGCRTRAAYVAFLCGGTGAIALWAARRNVSPRLRFAAGVLAGLGVVGLATAFVVGAGKLGFDPVSARIRLESIKSSLHYLAAHPLLPTGLGNLPGRFPAFNTWIALSVALSPLATLGLAVFIVSGLVKAARLPDIAWFAAGLAFLGPTMTENLVFAGSSITLSWFIYTGLVLGYQPGGQREELGSPTT